MKKAKKKAIKKNPKKIVKKTAKKARGPKLLGKIMHYYDKIAVAAIKLVAPLKVGDTVNIKGHTTDFCQKIDSMQINHQNVVKAKKGDEIGIKVKAGEAVRDNDNLFEYKETKAKTEINQQKPAGNFKDTKFLKF